MKNDFAANLVPKMDSSAHKFGVLPRVGAPSTARHDTAPAAAERAPAYSVRCSRLPGHRARFSMGGGVNLQTTYSLVMHVVLYVSDPTRGRTLY